MRLAVMSPRMVQIDLQDQSVLALQEDLAEKISTTGASGVVIAISADEIVDWFIGRMFATTMRAVTTATSLSFNV
ncbi:hypothetical protein [Amycolatopsis sp. NBC_01286]|uniref:hypothetical protein n=1 Tax=Amycolatopsis sp. NBC_01286 TaxID=2903560 RepID=UPI002E0F6D14|nr:hypothetical protein OG570_28680 [Amycolatopsis sp. NBC_01286]